MAEILDKDGKPMADSGLDENGFIPGTTFKTQEEMVKGYTNLSSKLDEQGNELGEIRKDNVRLSGQTESLTEILRNSSAGAKEQETVTNAIDYSAQLSAVEGQITSLDPLSPTYQKDLGALVSQSNQITAQAQHEKTLNAAGELMQRELSERDIKSAHSVFRAANPAFDTPEMQARIKEYIAKDPTGMADSLVAFREIQRDDIAAEKVILETENAEYKRLLDLNKGKDTSGKVVTTAQGTGVVTPKHEKVTGPALDEGMAGALQALRE